jgi:hypothetical protein
MTKKFMMGKTQLPKEIILLTKLAGPSQWSSDNIITDITTGAESLLMILSSKEVICVRRVHSESRSTQIIAAIPDRTIQQHAGNFCALFSPRYLKTTHYTLVYQHTHIFEGIVIKDDEIMLILSSKGPIIVKNISAGNKSVLVMGQMSAESIAVVADQFSITFNAMNQPPGIYKLVVNTSENPRLVVLWSIFDLYIFLIFDSSVLILISYLYFCKQSETKRLIILAVIHFYKNTKLNSR